MIEVDNLTYVFADGSVGVQPTNLRLPSRSRTLLIGANGAGKSTLLRVLSGKTLAKAGAVKIYNKDPFRDNDLSITYLGTEWAANPIVRYDISVVLLLQSMGGDAYPERRDELVNILDIDLRWHMHQVSDGERRRVQLAMGLLRPWTTLLLDEVTVDLDVLVRARLLEFLQKETESRDCTIMYATHIFDGIGEWPTHVVHLHLGKITYFGEYTVSLESQLDQVKNHHQQQELRVAGEVLKDFSSNKLLKTSGSKSSDSTHTKGQKEEEEEEEEYIIVPKNSVLLELALQWLRRDLKERGERGDKIKWDDIRDLVMNAPK